MRLTNRIGGASLLALLLSGTAAAHPLDGLTADEMAATVAILKAAGKTTDDARFPLIELKEPEKGVVLAWQPGQPEPRVVTVNVKEAAGTFKGEVDLVARMVLSWDPAAGETMILLEEFLGAMDVALADPGMQAGLAKRGLTKDQVFCIPLTAGAFGDPEEQGRRLMKVPCLASPTGSNFYAKPIEGLFAVIDLNKKEVVRVVDTGVRPVPADAWGYTDAENQTRDGALRPEANPVALSQPKGPSFKLDGSQVTWDLWRFRLRVDKRPGVVLSQIEVRDGNAWRSVLYQANLSEVFVPYMDPDQGWYWRTYMDSGEYGFGIFLSPLRKGVDCPAYATFLPAVVPQDNGAPAEIPDAVCIFERNIGDPAWRHYEIFAQTPGQPAPAEGRPWTELVVRSASEVGNYDYLMDYVFQQNGMIRIMVGATGLDIVKGVAATSMSDPTAAADTAYGTLIAPNLVAPNHDHFFNYRLDFDVDGTANSFVRTALVPQEAPKDLARRSYWVTQDEMPMTELEGRFRVDPMHPAMYHVMNHGKDSGLGHHPGYMIMPENSVAYTPLDFANDPPAKRNAFIDYTLWNTPYDRSERYAGGEYAFQSDGSDGLAAWVKQDRPIHDADIVTWYTMGFHHVPHMEDWPVMSTMWKGITLMPFNFFSHNPAMTIPSPPS